MILKKWSMAAAALLLVAPLSAGALGLSIVNVSVSGPGTSTPTLLDGGDTITFDLVLENPTGELVTGLGLGVTGYDDGAQGFFQDNRLVFAGGTSAGQALSQAWTGTQGIGGITNLLQEDAVLGVIDNDTPVQVGGVNPFPQPPNPTTLEVLMFNGIDTAGTSGNGTFDRGIGGGQTLPAGDVHFQISFTGQELATAGEVTLDFGTFGANIATGFSGEIPFTNTQYTLTVVPEPGTALLMGLGLAGLAGTRRR